MDEGERCRERSVGDIGGGCRWQVMMPTHTPKDRNETARRGCNWAWRGSYMVRVRWG